MGIIIEVVMKTLLPYKLDDVQTQLHFQNLSKINNDQAVKLQTQDSRLGFIQYCLSQGKNLKSAEDSLDDFVRDPNPKLPVGQEIAEPTQGDLNRQKLAALFAHNAAIGYEFGELSIEPIATNDLIKKMHEINVMSDSDAATYLQELVGHKIPASDQVDMEEFLAGIEAQYKSDGLNFHLLQDLNKANSSSQENPNLTKTLKNLFFFGKSRAAIEGLACDHNVIVDIDNTGKLKSIEHKNGKAEETILAQTSGIAPSFVTTDKAAETLKSIEVSIQNLKLEIHNIKKVPLTSENSADRESMVAKGI